MALSLQIICEGKVEVEVGMGVALLHEFGKWAQCPILIGNFQLMR
jgi:hypothetical protein